MEISEIPETFLSRTLEYDSRARSNQTRLQTRDTKRSSVLSETTLNYTKVLGSHDISAVAGIEFQNFYIGRDLFKRFK